MAERCECGTLLRGGPRYPLQPLLDLLGGTVHSACASLGITGSTFNKYLCHGMTEKSADRAAARAGVPAYSMWPEMILHVIADGSMECANDRCTARFVPAQTTQRFCSNRCGKKVRQRRYLAKRRTDPAYREKELAYSRAYREECADYCLASHRRWYQENRQHALAYQHQYRTRKRAEREEAAA